MCGAEWHPATRQGPMVVTLEQNLCIDTNYLAKLRIALGSDWLLALGMIHITLFTFM